MTQVISQSKMCQDYIITAQIIVRPASTGNMNSENKIMTGYEGV